MLPWPRMGPPPLRVDKIGWTLSSSTLVGASRGTWLVRVKMLDPRKPRYNICMIPLWHFKTCKNTTKEAITYHFMKAFGLKSQQITESLFEFIGKALFFLLYLLFQVPNVLPLNHWIRIISRWYDRYHILIHHDTMTIICFYHVFQHLSFRKRSVIWSNLPTCDLIGGCRLHRWNAPIIQVYGVQGSSSCWKATRIIVC